MSRRVPNTAVLVIEVIASVILAFSTSAFAQRVEHYNSPLYSPRYYDPNGPVSNGMPDALKKVGIEQRLGEPLPLDAKFRNENGEEVKLREYFKSGRPVILALVYYECPMLCNEVLNGLTGSLKGISLSAGKDFDVLAISFDSRENDKADLARNKKASYLARYDRPGTDSGWHFLTGTQDSVDAVTNAAGFKYYWDDKTKQFAHAGGIMIVTPEGKLSKYFYGIEYAPKDVKFGIMDSSKDRIGNPAEQLLLYCYHYDPATGKYGFAIIRALQLAGIATLIGFGSMLFVFWRKGKRREI
jgi:protein SCO1/2